MAVEPAVFLDRDNTLIANRGDLGDVGSVRLVEGAAEALLALRRAGYRLVVVTNQGGVARGKFTEADVDAVHQRIAQLLDDELHQPELIERFYYCPYHPEGTVEEYRREHSWRKPNPGMILQASRDMELDLEHSWMIGDQHRDIAAGRAAGCRTMLLCNGGASALQTIATKAATSLAVAAKMIVRNGDPEPTRSAAATVVRQMHSTAEVPTAVLESPPALPMRSEPESSPASKPLVTIDLTQDVQPSVEPEPPVTTERPSDPELTLETKPATNNAVPTELPILNDKLEAPEPQPALDPQPPSAVQLDATAEAQPELQASLETEAPPSVDPPSADELPAPIQTPQTYETPAISESVEQAAHDFNSEVPVAPLASDPQSADRSLTEVRRAILELSDEVRSERVRRSDLTPAKMTAGITELLVVLCAFFGLLQLGDPESFEAFVKWILGGALLQLVTITLLLLDQRG